MRHRLGRPRRQCVLVHGIRYRQAEAGAEIYHDNTATEMNGCAFVGAPSAEEVASCSPPSSSVIYNEHFCLRQYPRHNLVSKLGRTRADE
ncbi:unnamed protein product [Protopolystoma xenopodis]|uniref:Uncharacterized protein n=1 Tax=Protopolystoma xenopodis TaxID=117903 RepID=A0A3S5C5D7_9PLAT|nr:unnamed protein product [Protopolystoma xenopodis]